MKLAATVRRREDESHAELARRVTELGYHGASIGFDHRWDEAELLAIRTAFDQQGVDIVELRCYCNFLTPRDDEARRNIDRLQRALQAGAILNCDHAVTYVGSRHPDPDQPFAAHPDNWADATWELLVQRIWAVLDGVDDIGVRLCFEPAPTTTLRSLDALADLTADATSVRVRVALDPAAIFTPEAVRQPKRALAEIFDTLADAIAVARATDVALDESGPEPVACPVPLGEGALDYETYLKLVAALQRPAPVVVPYVDGEEECRAARQFLLAAAQNAGVAVE
ncbi:MAG: sugar phosphate isomerase/epimerase family protein [Candidatus Brocadiia bacterium]